MEDWRGMLACPRCRAPLDRVEGGYRCPENGCAFAEKEGRVFFPEGLGEQRGHLGSVDGKAMVAGYRHPSGLLSAARKVISSEYFPGGQWRRAKREVLEGDGLNLIIGSGVTRYQGAVHLDLDDFPGVDVIANAEQLPFRDHSFQGVLCEVVLEHVARPERLIAETWRVLRPGGSCFFILPFLFPFHGHPGDYRRWSRQGIAEEFSAFRDVRIGIHGGPCSAMVNLLSEWAYVLSGLRFPRGYTLIKGGFTALLFPLKYLDYFVNRFPEAHRLAATLYLSARKP